MTSKSHGKLSPEESNLAFLKGELVNALPGWKTTSFNRVMTYLSGKDPDTKTKHLTEYELEVVRKTAMSDKKLRQALVDFTNEAKRLDPQSTTSLRARALLDQIYL